MERGTPVQSVSSLDLSFRLTTDPNTNKPMATSVRLLPKSESKEELSEERRTGVVCRQPAQRRDKQVRYCCFCLSLLFDVDNITDANLCGDVSPHQQTVQDSSGLGDK